MKLSQESTKHIEAIVKIGLHVTIWNDGVKLHTGPPHYCVISQEEKPTTKGLRRRASAAREWRDQKETTYA